MASSSVPQLDGRHEWIEKFSLESFDINDHDHDDGDSNDELDFARAGNDREKTFEKTIYDEGISQMSARVKFTSRFDYEVKVEVELKALPFPPDELSLTFEVKKDNEAHPDGPHVAAMLAEIPVYNRKVIQLERKSVTPQNWTNNIYRVCTKRSDVYQHHLEFKMTFKYVQSTGLPVQGPTILDMLQKMLFDERTSDVQVICGTQVFPCHKFVLCGRSDVFKAMFEGDVFKEGQDGVLKIEDVQEKTMKTFLKYMYTDTISFEEINCDLLYAANKYNFPRLVSECVGRLALKINEKSILQILKAAYLLDKDDLLKVAMKAIKNGVKPSNKLEWDALKREHRGLASKVADCFMFGN